MNKQKITEVTHWWKALDCTSSTRLQLKCAELKLEFTCEGNDCLVRHELTKSTNKQETEVHYMTVSDKSWKLESQKRFLSQQPLQQVKFQPAMADRPIVCRPMTTVVLLPNEEISLYIGLPLWLKLIVNDLKTPLIDIPTERISDTWFGPNSQDGIMAYASRTILQLDTKPTPEHKIRATVELKIQNDSDDMLVLDKVSVPAPNLGLYVDKDGKFYTHRITIAREGDDLATLTIDNAMSCGLDDKDLTLISEARVDIGRNKITKALRALLG